MMCPVCDGRGVIITGDPADEPDCATCAGSGQLGPEPEIEVEVDPAEWEGLDL